METYPLLIIHTAYTMVTDEWTGKTQWRWKKCDSMMITMPFVSESKAKRVGTCIIHEYKFGDKITKIKLIQKYDTFMLVQ